MKNVGLVIWSWAIITVAVVLFHIIYIEEHIELSDCHSSKVQWYHDKPMCTECKLFCELKK